MLPIKLLSSILVADLPNPVLLDLPDGQWSELSGTSMLDHVGDIRIDGCDDSYCDLNGILDYSGGVLDAARGRIIVFGGGHSGYFCNQVLTFELATLSWKLWYAPSPIADYDSSEVDSCRLSTGLPKSRHTYDHMAVLPDTGELMVYSGACSEEYPYHAGGSYGDLWLFDFGAGMWRELTAQLTGGDDYNLSQPGNSGEYDVETDSWYQITGSGVWRLNLDTTAWSYAAEDTHPGIERSSALDTVRREIFSYGGDYGGDATLTSYDIDAGSMRVVATDAPPRGSQCCRHGLRHRQ